MIQSIIMMWEMIDLIALPITDHRKKCDPWENRERKERSPSVKTKG